VRGAPGRDTALAETPSCLKELNMEGGLAQLSFGARRTKLSAFMVRNIISYVFLLLLRIEA
jgi:hypothetical protein